MIYKILMNLYDVRGFPIKKLFRRYILWSRRTQKGRADYWSMFASVTRTNNANAMGRKVL